MKSLRRSLNDRSSQSSSSTNHQQSYNPISRPSEKVAPPKKVIKALRSHKSANPQELSYVQGDFWYVTGERDGWYEALNPLSGSRGLVPMSDFEEFAKGGSKGRPESNQNNMPTSSMASPPPMPAMPGASRSANGTTGGRQPVYAVVQYDFQAERPDELDAKKGEPIMVIAQSNHEWFVAKPIGRLGGPGLIPVAFVEIRDPATGRAVQVTPDAIPMVEEWKKATAEYKAAAIPLGRFDLEPPISSSTLPRTSSSAAPAGSSTMAAGGANMGGSNYGANGYMPYGQPSQSSSGGRASGSNVNGGPRQTPLYRPEEDLMLPPGELTALSVPSFHNESGNYWFRLHVTFLPDKPNAAGYTLSLYRTYEDFYDFQIELLETFPVEAGRTSENGEEPERILPYMPGPVDEGIDDELTEYRREELDLYVKALVDLRHSGKGYIIRHELLRTFFAAKSGDYCEEIPRSQVIGTGLEERLADTRLNDGPGGGMSRSQSGNGNLRQAGNGSSGGYNRQQSSQDMRSTSSASRRSGPSPLDTSRPISGTTDTHGGPSTGGTASSSFAAAQSAQSQSAQMTSGSGSGGGQQPPYIKIKIYDRSTDDLIALRVHPNVNYGELMEKVKARLGPEISTLKCRTAMSGPGGGNYRVIRDDRELRDWMRVEDQKMVLYAE